MRRLQISEVHLVDNTKLPVGDHQSKDDDDADEDEESQQYPCEVADHPGVVVASLLALRCVAANHLGSLYVHVGELERSLERREGVQLGSRERVITYFVKFAGPRSLYMFALQVGEGVANTVAVVKTVRTSGLVGVPGGVGDKEGLGRQW